MCHNRYDLLHQGNVLGQSDTAFSNANCDHDLIEKEEIKDNNVEPNTSDCPKESYFDACYNPCKNTKSKIEIKGRYAQTN